MNIGIIGSGKIGGTLARLLVNAGHKLTIANSRGPESLKELVKELESNARAGTVEEAARFGEMVIVSIPLRAFPHLPKDVFDGKIVIDTMNYYPQRDGRFEELDSGRVTSSELFQRFARGAKVVKAFNAMRWDVLATSGRPAGAPDRLALPISGDDAQAKEVVEQLIDGIGFDSVDAGPLGEGGRLHQVGSPVYTVPLTRPELSRRLHAS
jgi:8-hydroxy-5-deazaflavin:NADPH oxidoreductase